MATAEVEACDAMSEENEGEACDAMSEENKSVILGDEFPDDVKKRKPGIIYLATVPIGMQVNKLRSMLSVYGTVGKIFLQLPETAKKETYSTIKKWPRYFTEGWVEFESKRVAKLVAAALNNTLVGGKKDCKLYDQMWNMKYLPRFKWVHLNERLAYERAVHRQRLRIEIQQVKKEANYFSHNVDVSENLQNLKKKYGSNEETSSESPLFLPRQRQNHAKLKLDLANSTSQKKLKRKKTKDKDDQRKDFLVDLFG